MPGFLARVKTRLRCCANFGILLHMSVTVIDLAERRKSVGKRTRATVKALKGYRGVTDKQIADTAGWTRQKVNSYVTGPTKFTDEALAVFAYALGVPEFVLLMEKDEALRWVLDHPSGPDGPGTPSDLPGQSSPCMTDNVIPLRGVEWGGRRVAA